jgi:biopolymer transport protein ExbD
MKREKPAMEPQVALRKREPRKPQEAELQMTMTPMIDCVFQLLIFFMLTGKFVTTEAKLSVFLPKEGFDPTRIEKPVLDPPLRVLLRWNPQIGRCKIYVGQVLCNYDEEGMRRALQRVRMLKQTGTTTAEIDAGGDVPMFWIVQALNMLIEAGIPKINFTGSMNPLADNK